MRVGNSTATGHNILASASSALVGLGVVFLVFDRCTASLEAVYNSEARGCSQTIGCSQT